MGLPFHMRPTAKLTAQLQLRCQLMCTSVRFGVGPALVNGGTTGARLRSGPLQTAVVAIPIYMHPVGAVYCLSSGQRW